MFNCWEDLFLLENKTHLLQYDVEYNMKMLTNGLVNMLIDGMLIYSPIGLSLCFGPLTSLLY